MALLREFGFAPCEDPPPAMSGLGVGEGLFTSFKNGRRVRGEYLIHQSMTTKPALEKRDFVPLLYLVEAVSFFPVVATHESPRG